MKLNWFHRNFIAVLPLAIASAVVAGGFSATVSPPRFELHAKPGETLQQVVRISNMDTETADYDLRTADWYLSGTGSVTIYPPELQPGSCRPWTRIESRHIRLPPQGQRSYRIQIAVPENAVPGECRVALLLEGSDDKAVMAGADAIRFPVQGRIAIIFYVTVGEAHPALTLLEMSMETVNGRELPVAIIRNDGTAHGRPSGFLQGEDALGRKFEFTVSPSPILPGQTRHIPIWPEKTDEKLYQQLVTPLHLTGTIEWEGGSKAVDATVSPIHRIGLEQSR